MQITGKIQAWRKRFLATAVKGLEVIYGTLLSFSETVNIVIDFLGELLFAFILTVAVGWVWLIGKCVELRERKKEQP